MGYSENNNSSGAYRTGQQASTSINNILNTVNLYNGSPAFPLSLVSLDGSDELNVSLRASFQGILSFETTVCNRDSLSSILGFGWSMGLPRIVVKDRSVRQSYQADFYLTGEGGEYPLYRTGVKNGAVSFFSVEHPQWELLFFENEVPSNSRWEIRKENGSTWIYGASSDSVEVNLSWDNWAGATLSNGGEPWPVGWYLSSVISYNKNCITYKYDNIMAPLGNGFYSRNIRLIEIVSTYKQRIVLAYKQKESFEYEPQHTVSRTGDNAYQSKWEDAFLDCVRVENSNGKLLYTQKLNYTFNNFSGEEGCDKRVLTSVVQISGDGTENPPLTLSYGGRESISPGALIEVNYPFGEKVQYTYQNNTFQNSTGCLDLQPPDIDWDTKLAQGSDFTVLLHSRGNEILLYVLFWDMGWQIYEPKGFRDEPVRDTRVFVGNGFFAVRYFSARENTWVVRLVKRSPVCRLEWETEEYVLSGETTEPACACGADFFAIQHRSESILVIAQYQYTDNTWHWNKLDQNPGNFCAIGAGKSCLFGAYYDTQREEIFLQTFYEDEAHVWQKGDNQSLNQAVEWELTNMDTVWSMGAGQASATFVSIEQNKVCGTVVMLRWRDKFVLTDTTVFRVSQGARTQNPILYTQMSDTIAGFAQNLFRYDPNGWNQTTLLEPKQGYQYAYAYGSDLALGVECDSGGRQRFYALRFDPYRSGWTSDGAPYSNDIDGSLCVPHIFGEYAIFGRTIFARNTDDTWKLLSELPEHVNPRTVQCLNDSLICQSASEEETSLLTIFNHTPLSVSSFSAQGCSLEESSLIRSDAFFTYTTGSSSQQPLLHMYYLGKEPGYRDLQTALSLKAVTLYTGFEEQTFSFIYDLDSTRLENGQPAFKNIRVMPGELGEDQGYIEYVYYNGLSPDSPLAEYPQDGTFSNVRQFYSHMAGRLYCSRTYDIYGKAVSATYNDLMAMDAQGFCINQTRVIKQRFLEPYDLYSGVRGGENAERIPVETVIENTYEPRFFLKRTSTKVGPDGQRICQTLRYAWEYYPQLLSAHLLDVVGQTLKTEEKEGALIEATSKIWEEGEDHIWRETKHLRFDASKDSYDIEENRWFIEQSVQMRGSRGIILCKADEDDLMTRYLYDQNEYFVVAEFNGIFPILPIYCGFEPYEVLPEGLADAWLIHDECYSGTQCLQLKEGQSVEFFTQASKTAAAVRFDCALKTKKDQAEIGKLELIYEKDGEKFTILKDLPSTEGRWEWFSVCIPAKELPDLEEACVTMRLVADIQGSFLVDSLFLTPLISGATAHVYESETLLKTAQLNTRSPGNIVVYNKQQQQVAQSLNDNTFIMCTRYISGALLGENQVPDETLSAEMPKGGSLHLFHRGWDFTKDWDYTPDWFISNKTLSHTQGTTGSLTLKQSLSNDYLLFFICASQCEALSVYANGVCLKRENKEWTISENGQILAKTSADELPGDCCMFLSTNGRVEFSAGNYVRLQIQTQQTKKEALVIETDSAVSLKTLGFCQSPRIKVTISDYIGRPRQDQSITETGITVAQSLYDKMGQAAVNVKQVHLDNVFWGYKKDFISSFDWESGLLFGEASTAYPEDNGYPYARILYSLSPEPRPVALGQAGEEWAIRSASNGSGPVNMACYIDPKALPNCQLDSVYEPGGKETITALDINKNKIGVWVRSQDGQIHETRYTYDESGRQLSALYYDENKTGDTPSTFSLMRYDFLGYPLEKAGSNCGKINMVYNLQGRMRFSQNGEGRLASKIIYHLYDLQGREIETGVFPGNWDENLLRKIAREDSNQRPTDAVWTRQMEYDGDGTDIYLAGRLWCCRSRFGDTIVAEEFSYDLQGNLIWHEQTVDGHTQSVKMEYSKISEITKTYGSAYGDVDLRYVYNIQGQMTEVWNKDYCLCHYKYYPAGGIKQEIFAPDTAEQLVRQYTYNSQQWLTELRDAYIVNSIEYKNTSRLNNGCITEENTQLLNTAEMPNDVLPQVNMSYDYDGFDRLSRAVCHQNPAYSIGATHVLAYDANGNLQGMDDTVYQYETGTDKLLETPDTMFGYDEFGSVSSISGYGVSKIQYDPVFGVVTEVESDKVSRKYYYTAANGVSAFDENGSRTYCMVGSDGRIVSETGPDKITTVCVRGASGIFAQIRQGKVFYMLRDQRASVRGIYHDGKLCAAYNYLPFGDFMGAKWETDIVADLLPMRFTGQRLEPYGLYRFKARLYDPHTGRFLGLDPQCQYASPYLYGGSDWINYIDPDGANGLASGLAILTGVALVVLGGALIVVSGGAATPAVAIFGVIASGALIGAGIGTTMYGISSAITGDFDLTDCLINAGAGALFGALGAAAGAAIPVGFTMFGLSTATSMAIVDVGVGIVLGGTDGLVTNGCLNVSHGESFWNNAVANTLIGASVGGLMSGLTGLSSAMRTTKTLHNGPRNNTIGVMITDSAHEKCMTHSSLWQYDGGGNLNAGTDLNFAPGPGRATAIRNLQSDHIPGINPRVGKIRVNDATFNGVMPQLAAVGVEGPNFNLVTNNCVQYATRQLADVGLVAPLWTRSPAALTLWARMIR